MTEREKREKAIEEMQCDIAIKCELHEMSGKCVIGDCARCKLGLLYDAGYRKEKEVRKETLQDLFTALQTHGQLFDYSGDDNTGFWAIDLDEVKDVIKQKFGVEVEE